LLGTVAHTPLKKAIQGDVDQFSALLSEGKLTTQSLSQ